MITPHPGNQNILLVIVFHKEILYLIITINSILLKGTAMQYAKELQDSYLYAYIHIK